MTGTPNSPQAESNIGASEEVIVPEHADSVAVDGIVEEDKWEETEAEELLINTISASSTAKLKRQKLKVVRKYSTRSSGKKPALGSGEKKSAL